MPPTSTHFELIKQANERISELSTQLIQIGRELSANQQSTRGLWHEIKGIEAKLGAVSKEFRGLVEQHERSCLANKKAIQRALSDSTPPPSSNDVDKRKKTIALGGNIEVTKIMLFIVLAFCAMLIGSGIIIGAFWTGGSEKAVKTIQDIGVELNSKKDSAKKPLF